MAARKFVVAGVQRSGTTLITTSLDSHPSIYCAGELFKMRPPRGGVEVKDGGYRQYVSSGLRLRLADRLIRPRLMKRFLDRFYAQPGPDAIGFKLMRNHLFPRAFPRLIPYIIERQISVVHIVRENILKTYVSRLMARQSGVFHGTAGRGANTQVTLPTANLVVLLAKIREQNEQLRELFHGKVPYASFTYEQYRADPETENRRLLEFLGLPAAPLETPLVKLTSDDLAAVVRNAEEVRRCLRGTEFEQWT